jgi:hypothetical protein
MTVDWHVYDGRERLGQLPSDEVERRYAAGTLDDSALVWMEGWADWRPIASALAWLRSQGASGARESAKAGARPAVKAGPPLVSGALALAVAALAVFGVLRLMDRLRDIIDTTNPATVVQSYQTLVWGLAAALGAVIAALWWLTVGLRRWRPKSMAPGLMRGILACCALLAAAYVALQLRLTPLVHEIAVRAAQQVASVGFQPAAGGWVTVSGEIGPHLADQIDNQVRAHPGAKGVLIDSPGGLTDQALKVAQLIERRGLDVRVEKSCISACIGILVSGRQRTAEWNAHIALHALAPAVNSYPTFLRLMLKGAGSDFEGYVARRGMPKAWIDQAEAVGPSAVRWTPPPDLLKAGVLTAVTRDGARLDATQAKWLWVEVAAGEKSGFSEVLEAIRSSAPDIVDSYADELYSGVSSGDAERARRVIEDTVRPLVRRAQLSAAAEPTYLYVETNLDGMGYFTQRGQWLYCEQYIGGQLDPGVGSAELRAREQAALAELIRSAGVAHWRPAEAGAEGSEAAREVAASALGRLGPLGIGADGGGPRERCLRTFYILQGVDRLGAERGAAAWRALLRSQG